MKSKYETIATTIDRSFKIDKKDSLKYSNIPIT